MIWAGCPIYVIAKCYIYVISLRLQDERDHIAFNLQKIQQVHFEKIQSFSDSDAGGHGEKREHA